VPSSTHVQACAQVPAPPVCRPRGAAGAPPPITRALLLVAPRPVPCALAGPPAAVPTVSQQVRKPAEHPVRAAAAAAAGVAAAGTVARGLWLCDLDKNGIDAAGG
jgi:hypothetical protein